MLRRWIDTVCELLCKLVGVAAAGGIRHGQSEPRLSWVVPHPENNPLGFQAKAGLF